MKKTVEEIYPVEEVAKEVLQNNKLPIEDDFAEGFIAGAILGAEWQKEQSISVDKALDSVEKAINLAHDKWSNNSATDAIEFAEWIKENQFYTAKGIWMRKNAFTGENEGRYNWTSLTSQQLYELYKQSKN